MRRKIIIWCAVILSAVLISKFAKEEDLEPMWSKAASQFLPHHKL